MYFSIMRKFLFTLFFVPLVCFSQQVNLVSYTTQFLEPSYSSYEIIDTEYQTVFINLTPFNVNFLDVNDNYSTTYSLDFFEHEDNVSYYWINNTVDIFTIDYQTEQISVLTNYNRFNNNFNQIWRFSNIINLNK
tara:strand:- start:5065 stop:5466 length:402 start_codon:yes stop_codon:yes gene_type:complete